MATESTPQGSGQRTRARADVLTGEFQPREAQRQRRRQRQPELWPFEPWLEREQAQRLAVGLGWFSIGLGAAQLLAPRAVCRVVGTRRDHSGLMRLIGLREIAAGIGLLSRRRQGAWLQARVAGDLMDLALLGATLIASPHKARALLPAAAVAGATVMDVYGARTLGPEDGVRIPPGLLRISSSEGLPVLKSTIINRTPEECYRFWHDFSNLPRFMAHVESVQVIDERRSHWVARGPAGTRVEWDSEITEDVPNEYIAWRSLPGSDVDHAGWVRFEPAPGGRGTIVRVQMIYRPLAGRAGALLVKLLGDDPGRAVQEDLRRFKSVLETGEIPTTRGQPAGTRSLIGKAVRLGERHAR